MEEPLVRITRRGEDEFISLTRPFEIMTQRCDGRQITSCHIRPGCLRRSEVAMGEHTRRLHYHDYFELMVVLEGELVQRIEQGVYHYHRGDACLLGRNARHGEQHDRPFYIVFLNLAPDYVRRLLDEDELVDESGARRLADGVLRRFLRQELEGTARFERGYLDFTPTLSAGGADRLAALLDRLTEEMLSQQPGSNLLVRGLLARIFGLLEDGGRYHASHMRPDSRTEDMLVARVANYLRERSGRVSREELAAALHYHPTYLNQLVKARTGMSILRLGQRQCIRQAMTLLRETDLTVAQVAQELGYHNRSYFYRIFQQETGLTPAQWRDREQRGLDNA